MFRQSWHVVLNGGMLRGQPLLYRIQLISHRHLRYATGLLHCILLGSTIAVARRGGPFYRLAAAAQLSWLALAAMGRLRARVPGASIAYYHVAVTWGTLAALIGYVREGAPVMWDKTEGTR